MPEHEPQEIFELLWAHVDRRLSAVDTARLNDLLQTSREARATYIQFIELTASLSWKASVNREERVLAELGQKTIAAEPSPARVASPIVRVLHTTFRAIANSPVVTTLCFAALIYGTFTYLAWDLWSKKLATGAAESDAVATARVREDARWSLDVAAKTDGSTIRRGELLKLDSGMISLNLKRGTDVVVEGPAEWSVDGENSVTLHAGKLLAKVPPRAVGFVVNTPNSRIVDLGTEFGVEVNPESKATEVYVLRGSVETTRVDRENSGRSQKPVRLSAGSAVRIQPSSPSDEPITFDNQKFVSQQTRLANDASASEVDVIPLGNLFDDGRYTPLAKAIETDTFRAVAGMDDLGVQQVVHGGQATIPISPHLLFDATRLGWNSAKHCSITNDAWGDLDDFENSQVALAGIRTKGTKISDEKQKIEDGIGMHANALISFDLDKIRAAGRLAGRSFEFVCDRAGISDDLFGEGRASVHMAVLLSDARRLRGAVVDGQVIDVVEKGGIWSTVRPSSEVLRADGRFCSFRVPISGNVKYLTLITTCADEDYYADHAVWSGARLEIK